MSMKLELPTLLVTLKTKLIFDLQSFSQCFTMIT